MKLSILIGTIPERRSWYDHLVAVLLVQITDKKIKCELQPYPEADGPWRPLTPRSFEIWENNGVEIISCTDNKEMSIGAKRQLLLEKARGEYITFIDDDDLVSSNYVDNILANLGKDAIGFLIECTFNGTGKCMASASSKYKSWAEDQDGFKYVRSIYHKTPVRRELALQCGGFNDMRFGEDHDYSMRIMPLIKSENFINEVMYYYMYKHQEHNAKYGIK